MEKIKYFDDNERKRFFKEIKKAGNARDLCLFNFMLHYGLRLREALHIKLDDLQDKQTRLYVRRVKSGKSFCFDLMPSDLKLLKDWLEEREKYSNAKSPYLFISKRSKTGMITAQGIQFVMLEYCKKANIPRDKAHPHVLRHTTAVNILMSGQDVFTVREVLGHKNINSSIRYLELGTPEKRKRLNKVFEKAFTD